MVGEKKEEDIVGRLEALRKKVPPPTVAKPPKKPEEPSVEPDESRRKLARVIGILVIVIILGAVFFVGSKFFLKPTETPAPGETLPPITNGDSEAARQARLAELATAKSNKIDEIDEAFTGLPPEYTQSKAQLTQDVKTSVTRESVEDINYELAATNAWRDYRKAEVDKKIEITGGVTAEIGDLFVKGADSIKSQIDVIPISELKGMIIKEMRSEYIPIRLSRDQAAGGFAKIGDKVNIHYKWTDGNATDQIEYLAKDGRVVDIMRAAGTISLSESEAQTQSGGGTEGKGNVTTISLGSAAIAISDGPYGASVGYQQLQKSSTYTVNLAEVQKAAAASKISEEELMENLEKYGVRLSEIERETNIGDFTAEYLMLVELTEDEASEVALRVLDPTKKANILITISAS
jgi:hypothetical protein